MMDLKTRLDALKEVRNDMNERMVRYEIDVAVSERALLVIKNNDLAKALQAGIAKNKMNIEDVKKTIETIDSMIMAESKVSKNIN